MLVDKAWNKETESEKICERIKCCFTNRWRTRYWVSVVYYEPEHGYNLFFISHATPIADPSPLLGWRIASIMGCLIL